MKKKKKILKRHTIKKKINNKTSKNIENKDNIFLIKSLTPKKDIVKSKKIFKTLKKSPKHLDFKEFNNNKSFSPKINKALVSLKTIPISNIFECNNLLETNIDSVCLDYTSKIVHNKLLKNLRASKHLNCNRFIAPKQFSSNCWFNTMFVTFFFSDKGRKFFRFFRQLMITGKKINGEKLPVDLAKIFFILNKIIEASYNQHGNANGKLIRNFNTNYFIENIYYIMLNKNIITYKKNESGNPIEYYKSIIKYLNYDAINIINIDIHNNNDFKNINKKILSDDIPEIIIIDIIDTDAIKINTRPLEFKILFNGISHRYKLDSAIIRDISRQHFCSLLTCNNQEYSFDGASFSRLSKYKWKYNLNKKVKWGFQGHTLKWSFMSGYQMLFYYKS